MSVQLYFSSILQNAIIVLEVKFAETDFNASITRFHSYVIEVYGAYATHT